MTYRRIQVIRLGVVGVLLALWGCDGNVRASTPKCGYDSDAALSACVATERYLSDLATIAQPRPSGSTHWQAVRDLCATRLAELGYEVELHRYSTGVNVIGQRGTNDGAHVLVSAHYDSIPNCRGADDNASGVAALLEVARVLANAKLSGKLTVACWDEEERGLIGSAAYASRARAMGMPITAAFVFEMLGFKSTVSGSQTLPSGFATIFPEAAAAVEASGHRGDFIAVIGDETTSSPVELFASRAATLGLSALLAKVPEAMKSSSVLAALRRSDHASFWDLDYPAIMLTDTAEYRNPNYHCAGGIDAPSDLDSSFTTQIMSTTIATVASMLGLP